MIYEHKKKISTIQKKMSRSDAIRRVDLELYEIKSKQLSVKLNDTNEEFLQLKKIFGMYSKQLPKLFLALGQRTYPEQVKCEEFELERVCRFGGRWFWAHKS